MSLTKARQQTIVGEGLALGALMLGVEQVQGQKHALEFDFRRAWRNWDESCERLSEAHERLAASLAERDPEGVERHTRGIYLLD